ncbi:plasma membrane heat shock protein [Apiospora sp. TS-2023a]
MSPPKKALIAVTSAHAPLYPDGMETGLFITDALHPFELFQKAGFEVDFVSETGDYRPDWLSLQHKWLSDSERSIWENHASTFRSKLDNLLKPGDIKPGEYGLFFASAGPGSLIDFPDAKGLQDVASKIYTNGGIVSAVCNAGAIFPGIIDPATSKSVISGKKVTGVTSKAWKYPTREASAAASGATYISPPKPGDDFTVSDGRIVTGAYTAGVNVVAERCMEAFNTL